METIVSEYGMGALFLGITLLMAKMIYMLMTLI